ncbi:MAG: DNA primase [Desulfobulbaceae bacterium]|nr:DNA primase [Desulfobulbaceae bacterium]
MQASSEKRRHLRRHQSSIKDIMLNSESQESITSRVKEQADIVQIIGECVDLKQSGVRFLGLCPFHGEKTPSFSIHAGQQFYHCFGCGESGDVFSFMMKYHNMSFPEALKELAGRYKIELPQRRQSKEEKALEKKRDLLFKVNEKCTRIYSHYLQTAKGAEIARVYLQERGVSAEIREKFRLGYAPSVEAEGWNYLSGKLGREEVVAAVEAGLLAQKTKGGTYDRFRDRIVFPLFDISGRVCGFGGRIVGDGQPKYLNSPESTVFNKGRLLLGLYHLKDAIREKKRAILVEGNFDLISLVAHGCENVAAPLGTALTREQLRLLKRFTTEITLLFDGDEAGEKAAVRAVPHFLAEQMVGHIALLPSGHDPDTYVRENGLEQLNRLLDKAESLPEFVLGSLIRQHGLTLDGKSKIVEALVPLVKAAVSPLQRSVVISHFAEKLGLPADHFQSLSKGSSSDPQNEGVVRGKMRKDVKSVPLSIAQKQLVEFMVLNPHHFTRLEENGLRGCLAGGIGEVLFLQLKEMVANSPDFEPEELLTALPEGMERRLIADLLSRASLQTPVKADGETGEEIGDMLAYLRISRLQKDSDEVMADIRRAESEGNLTKLQELIAEKVEISRRMQGVDNF